MNPQDFPTALRQLADFYEEHPNCPLPDFGMVDTAYIFTVNTKEDIVRFVRDVAPVTKEYQDVLLYLNKKVGLLTLRAPVYRSKVCTSRVVGQKTCPAIPEHTVDVLEWDCKPILEDENLNAIS